MTLSAPQSASFSSPDGSVRVLSAADMPDLDKLLQRDPETYCVVSERVEAGALEPTASGGQTWGWFVGERLESAIYVGANVIPIETTEQSRDAFAARLARIGRRSSAIVGQQAAVLDLWRQLSAFWDPAREIREEQPLLKLARPSTIDADTQVRPVTTRELDKLLPAAIAMFVEEVGVSPVSDGRAPSYRARLSDTVRKGRAYARFSKGQIVFKAELGSVSRRTAQIQGVWVDPAVRGQGTSAPALAAVVEAALRDHARSVSLYVNAHNTTALRTYDRVGFEQVGTLATVLF